MRKKNERKGLPKMRKFADDSFGEITTKNSLDELKDLEEEPFGTPPPNLPENNVEVVTRAITS